MSSRLDIMLPILCICSGTPNIRPAGNRFLNQRACLAIWPAFDSQLSAPPFECSKANAELLCSIIYGRAAIQRRKLRKIKLFLEVLHLHLQTTATRCWLPQGV